MAPDADADGVPDSSPAGLTNPLPITEATAGTSTSSADTDGDGMSDLTELMNNTNPLVSDSDGDGTPDGADLNPAYKMNDKIVEATPNMTASTTMTGWTVLTSDWGWTQRPTTPATAATTATPIRRPPSPTPRGTAPAFIWPSRGKTPPRMFRIDGDADNWFLSADNYDLYLGSGTTNMDAVKINVGTPDIFRQVDEVADNFPIVRRQLERLGVCPQPHRSPKPTTGTTRA